MRLCVHAFPVRKPNELLTLQKRSSSFLQRERHQIVLVHGRKHTAELKHG